MRGKQTAPETVYRIMADYAVTGNFSETSRNLRVPGRTVEKVYKDNKDKAEFAKLRDEKRADFAKMAGENIDLALKRLKSLLSDKNAVIPANQLSTVIGTLYDKRALANGESTDNVTFKLPPGIDKYAE
jgi:hypothetical protein